MAEKPTKPKPPTYDTLAAENAALRARLASLEGDIQRRDDTEAWRRTKKAPLKLDPKSASAFRRPWDGR